MKKTVSILLSIIMLLGLVVLPASAQAMPYPESEHNYQNNINDEQTYTYDGDCDGLFVTFDENTYVEYVPIPYYSQVLFGEDQLNNASITLDDDIKYGDYITIYYKNDCIYGIYQGDELAGETLYIPGKSFKIVLTSDESNTYYGYKVTDISTACPQNQALAVYHVYDDVNCYPVDVGSSIYLNSFYNHAQYGDELIIGWQTKTGEKYYYNIYNLYFPEYEYMTAVDYANRYNLIYGTDIEAKGGMVYDFYPITVPISVRSDEVYSFNNSEYYFCPDDMEGYYYTDAHYRQQFIDYGVTFGLTPLMPAGTALAVFYTRYWPDMEWVGSCCGFPITVVLQKEGEIDLLSEQGVKSVSELKPTKELISTINFYNNQAATSFPCNNWGYEPGTKAYSNQLKALYESLVDGNPCYFEYYGNGGHVLKKVLTARFNEIDFAHGVLLTGAYTDIYGNHILIGYNNQTFNYTSGSCDIYIIDKDFTKVTYQSEELVGFSWNDDFSQYKSLPAEGVPSPTAWHVAFFKHLIGIFKDLWANLLDKFS